MLLFAASLAASGCSRTLASNGAGYEQMTPAPPTRAFILANDKPFARQVAAHIRTCKKDEACLK